VIANVMPSFEHTCAAPGEPDPTIPFVDNQRHQPSTAAWALYAGPGSRIIQGAMRRTDEVASRFIEKLAFQPVQLNQFMGTAIQKRMCNAFMPDDERRYRPAFQLQLKAKARAAITQHGAVADAVTGLPQAGFLAH
jgi:hypothetical protein